MTLFSQRAPGVELTHDRTFEARIRRLSVVSLFALGTITWLAIRDDASSTVVLLLTAGWISMPTVLRASLRRPGLRYALSVPATLFAGGLTLFSTSLADLEATSAAGWWTITVSLWFGAVLGMWLWFRWLPVPAWLTDPFGPGRLAFVTAHIGGVLIGIALVIA
jgi:hypothetical protein